MQGAAKEGQEGCGQSTGDKGGSFRLYAGANGQDKTAGKEAATADDVLHQLHLLHRDAVLQTGLPGPPTPTTRGFLKAAAASTPLNGKSDP